MARIITQQPDGKLSVFSTIVDQFILVNATVEELIKVELQEAEISIRQSVLNRVKELSIHPAMTTCQYDKFLRLHNATKALNNSSHDTTH